MRQRMLNSGREIAADSVDDNAASIVRSLLVAKAAGLPGSLGGLTVRTKVALDSRFTGMTIRGAISGGRRLTGWRPLTTADAGYPRIPAALRGSTWFCDLAANGVTSTGVPARRVNTPGAVVAATIRLFGRSDPLPEARYPASGWLNSTDNPAPNQMTIATTGMPVPSSWASVRVYGFPVYDYRGESVPVSSFNSPTLTLAYSFTGDDATAFAGRTSRYALVGAPEWMTEGTWWADPAGLKIYYACGASGPGEVTCDVVEDSIIEFTGSGVTLDEVKVRHGRKAGIAFAVGYSGCAVRRSEVSFCERPVEINAAATVKDCDVRHFGLDGVGIKPTGDRATLTPSGVLVEGNRITGHIEPLTQAGIHAFAGSGVGSKGVGYVIRGNRLWNLAGAGIIVAGNDHIVEGNLIEDVSTDVDDFPGIYVAGRDYTFRGTRIVGNTLRRVYNRIGTSSPVFAIYLDDCASGVTVAGNVLTDVAKALFFGGGRDNAFVGNAARLLPGGHLLHGDARAAFYPQWMAQAQVEPTEGSWQVQTRCNQFSVTTGLWATRYPALAAMSTVGNAHRIPNGNTMFGNGVWDGARWVSDLSPYVYLSPADLSGAGFVPQTAGGILSVP